MSFQCHEIDLVNASTSDREYDTVSHNQVEQAEFMVNEFEERTMEETNDR